jgi:hypothetical protein
MIKSLINIMRILKLSIFLLMVILPVVITSCVSRIPVNPDDSGNLDTINKQDFRTAPTNAAETSAYLRTMFQNAGYDEAFGKNVMDACFVEIDKMLTQGFDRSGSVAVSDQQRQVLASGDCETFGASFELDGVQYDGSYSICPLESQDKIVFDFSFFVDVKGTSGGGKEGQTLKMELVIQASTDKCPSTDGKVKGESLSHILADATVDGVSSHFLCDTQFNIDATINDDAEVDTVDCNLNIGADGYDSTHPQTGYGGVSHITNSDFDFTNNSFRDKLIDGLSPQGPCPNPKGIGLGLGIAVAAAKSTAEDAKENWQKDGKCIEIQQDPEDLDITSGEKKPFDITVIYIKDGSEVEAKLEASTENGKEITPSTAEFSPGTPVKFEYTAPDDGSSGDYQIKAVSKCGKDRIDIMVQYDMHVVIDSTLTFDMSGLHETGHVRAEIPIAYSEELGHRGGIGPGDYLDFQFSTPGDCTYETISKSCSDIRIIDFAINEDEPSATRVVFTPFTTTEALMAHCPDGDGPGPPVSMFFANNFHAAHLDEFIGVDGGMAYVITNWEVNSAEGIPLVKHYDRTISAFGITESTVIEIHTVAD